MEPFCTPRMCSNKGQIQNVLHAGYCKFHSFIHKGLTEFRNPQESLFGYVHIMQQYFFKCPGWQLYEAVRSICTSCIWEKEWLHTGISKVILLYHPMKCRDKQIIKQVKKGVSKFWCAAILFPICIFTAGEPKLAPIGGVLIIEFHLTWIYSPGEASLSLL